MKTETTLNITGIKNNGFRVVVGIKKGCGSLNYIKGTKAQALKLGQEVKEQNELMFKQQNLIIDITPMFLRECESPFCNNLSEEHLCLRCEDLMFEAQQEAQEQARELEVENYGY